jgi:hypothetical protein
VSYGAYVQACIDERRSSVLGSRSWEFGAVKYANDNFADFPEEKVVEVLCALRWPDRPVTVSEVLCALRCAGRPPHLHRRRPSEKGK